MLGIGDVSAVMIESRKSTYQASHYGHGVSITSETTQEKLHLLIHHGVVVHQFVKVCALLRIRQVAFQEQVASVQIVAVVGQLLNGIAAVEQLTFVAINEGNVRLARGRRQEAWVISEHASLAIQFSNIDHIRTNAAAVDGHFNAGAAVAERQGCFVVGKFHDSISSVNQSIQIFISHLGSSQIMP